MKIISHSGNEVYVGHFQGKVMEKFEEIVEEMSKKEVKVDERIKVITIYDEYEKAITAKQLEISGVRYSNGYRKEEKEFSNVDKIKYYLEKLEETSEEYSLLVDAYDVVFFNDIDYRFIEKFREMEVEVVYNATKNNYPKAFKEEEGNEEYKYLNAGVVFGKTSYLRELYREINELTRKEEIINPWKSEQLYVRIVVEGRKEIKIDKECVLFQTFSKTQKTVIGQAVIIM